MTARPIPTRHWRSYGTEPLPTGREALEEPFRAFPSWFMRITCDRCGQERMRSHLASRNLATAAVKSVSVGLWAVVATTFIFCASACIVSGDQDCLWYRAANPHMPACRENCTGQRSDYAD